MPGAPQTRSRVAFGAGAILALLGALGAAELATVGVASDPTTTRADLIVHGDDAGLTRLGVSGAPDGGVLTAANGALSYASPLPSTSGVADGGVLTTTNGAVAWAAAPGGGTHGAGTLASRPASPSAGDTYEVTSGAALHDRYLCTVAGTWRIVSYDRIREDETPYLWWRLNEASGNAASSGSASSATLTATSIAGYHTPLLSLPIRGMWFSSSKLSGADSATALSTAWTIAAWVYPRDTSLSAYRTVCALDYNTGAFGQPYVSAGLAQSPSGVRAWITTTAQTGSGQEVTATAPLLLNGGPHHIVARFTGSALQVVIDGVQRATLATNGGTTAIGPSPRWTVGHQYDGQEYWNGEIADVRVYDSSKSDAWCLETWARGVGAYEGQ